MAAGSYEHQLICKIIETGDMLTPQRRKFTHDTFTSLECRAAFAWLQNYVKSVTTYGQVPSWQLFNHYFPGIPWCGTWDSLEVLCEHVSTQRLREKLHRLAAEITTRADANPREGLALIRESAVLLGGEFTTSQDVLMSDAYNEILQEYYSTTDVITGIPFPWEYLSLKTQGKQEGDFIFFFGRPGEMKSWVGVALAAAYSYTQAKKRVLVWSLEMSPKRFRKRIASIVARVDYEKFQMRQLEPVVAKQMFDTIQWLRHMEMAEASSGANQPALLITKPEGGANVSALEAKIEEFQPDEVYIDGVYLMEDELRGKEHHAQKNVSRAIKKVCSHTGVPITAISQQNRSNDKKQRGKRAYLDDMAFTDAYGQDADLVFHVRLREQEQELIISPTKGREALIKPFVINAIPSVDFGFKRFHVEADEQEQEKEQQNYQPIPSWGSR